MSLIPTKERWRSWAMPTRITIVVSIIGLIGMFFFGLYQIFNTSNNQQNNIQTNSGDIVNGDKTVNNDNRKYITEDNQGNKLNNSKNKISSRSPKNEFTIKGVSSKSLSKFLQLAGGISISTSAKNTISIGFTGDIQEISESNSSRFSGGYLKISTSVGCENILKEFPIHQIRENPKYVIDSEIKRIITNYVNDNTDLIAEKILECID